MGADRLIADGRLLVEAWRELDIDRDVGQKRIERMK
jgi:hypothetical protein